jgi:hypothetical protein
VVKVLDLAGNCIIAQLSDESSDLKNTKYLPKNGILKAMLRIPFLLLLLFPSSSKWE